VKESEYVTVHDLAHFRAIMRILADLTRSEEVRQIARLVQAEIRKLEAQVGDTEEDEPVA
jgi:uncharacterized circularly permuted ATP-grasp superfamily protein